MPINEQNVIILLSEVETAITANRDQRNKLRDLYQKAKSIQLVVVPEVPAVEEILSPDKTTVIREAVDKIPAATSPPIDEKLGTPMTNERREAIYDIVLADAASLIE